MINKFHNGVGSAGGVMAYPRPSTQTHATQTFREEGVPLHSKTVTVAWASAAACSNPYSVRKGDTLAKIARRCGVSVASLKKLNSLSGDTIMVGQTLVIRASRGSAPNITPVPTPTIESSVSPW